MNRVVGVITVAVLAVTGLAGAAAGSGGPGRERAAAPAPPTTAYEMPFPCGQAWTGTTRSDHSPSRQAVDWNRPDDTDDEVVAAAAGTVVRAERGASGYGTWVMLEHLDGERTVYAHLSSLRVAVGQTVDQGSLLGTVGETGRAYGAHLHFEERDAAGVVAPYFHDTRFEFGSTRTSQNCVDLPLAGNFLGGPEAELAVYRRTDHAVFVIRRPSGDPLVVTFGRASDQPVVGDWDGDGLADAGVRAAGRRVFRLLTGAGTSTLRFGAPRDLPLAGDWDGDGRWEVGVRRADSPTFRLRAADGTATSATLGDVDDLPVTGDWDGDGRTDLGVYDQATAVFTLRLVDHEGLAWTTQVRFGQPGDLPVTGDWDGNRRTDLGVWTPATAIFTERRAPSVTSARAATTQTVFGTPR